MEPPRLERCDSYEDQLRSLFISCDFDNRESLDETQLKILCGKLELGPQQTATLMRQLLDQDRSRVPFGVFKEGLVLFLERLSSAEEDEEQRQRSPEREVEPKFVVGDRRYGRRSRPGSVDLGEEKNQQEDEDDANSTQKVSEEIIDLNFLLVYAIDASAIYASLFFQRL